MLHPSHIIDHLGGVARTALLERYGVSRRELSRAIAEGTVTRVRVGVVAVPTADGDIVSAAGHGGAVTCLRSLRLHGVWTLGDDEHPHVWLGSHGRVHHLECSCVNHYFGGRTVLGLAPLVETLVHVLRCRGPEVFFASLESALRLRLIRAGDRARIRMRIPTEDRWLVDFARVDADSGLESLLRLRLRLLGVRLDCQVVIPTVGRVDFVIERMLILEADGKENHDGAVHRHKDLRRDAAASLLGYETIRFDYALIVHDWPVVEAAVVAAIVRARSRA